jgi:hypothetical protein
MTADRAGAQEKELADRSELLRDGYAPRNSLNGSCPGNKELVLIPS